MNCLILVSRKNSKHAEAFSINTCVCVGSIDFVESHVCVVLSELSMLLINLLLAYISV